MNVLPDYTAAISKALGSFIQSKSSTFACGGSIQLKAHVEGATQATATSSTVLASPVILRWDSSGSPTGISKLPFPIEYADEAKHAVLSDLIRQCQPAGFGYKGENVLDETYRKATKMDRSVFSVDFCPYEAGIIDTVAQLLLPNSSQHVNANGVRAELYKLNIYAAPSGFFRSHVDTPRSSMQFGSLVISLPCHHKGGQLIVRHAQHSRTFDWGTSTLSTDSSSAIRWAAFYSDCEHEVLEVTEGHRITLTYNLYYAPGVGNMAGINAVMDPQYLPLFQYVQEALRRSDFMPQGGHLGVFCQHAYAHTHEDGARALPGVLKGSDMAVYNIFKALGLDMQVRAILDTQSGSRSESLNDYLEIYEERALEDSEDELRIDYKPPFFQLHTVVGSLGGYGAVEMDDMDAVIKEWSDGFMNIVWVNAPRHSGLDVVHLTYGNEAGLGTLYSYAAILVRIPTPHERGSQGMENHPITID